MTSETQKLIEAIKKYYNINDLSELNEKQWKEISGYRLYKRLTEEFIEKYADKLDWKSITLNQNLSEKFMEKHADKIHWYCVGIVQQDISEDFIQKHADKLNWDNIFLYIKLSPNFILKNIKYMKTTSAVTSNKKINLAEKINNIEQYPEWVHTLLELIIKEHSEQKRFLNHTKFFFKFYTDEFWINYINYIKQTSPDKKIFALIFLETVNRIFYLDIDYVKTNKNYLKKKINKILKKLENKNNIKTLKDIQEQ